MIDSQVLDLPAPFHGVALGVVNSTNDEMSQRLADGAGHGLVITARQQLQGRGRQNRLWQSPPGNLYCSILLRPPAAALSEIATLAFVIGLAVHEMIAAQLPQPNCATVKWPNDVLLDGAKVSGILIESAVHNGSVAAIVGIGINLTDHRVDAPYAVSNLAAYGVMLSPEQALVNLLSCLRPWYDLWLTDGFRPVRQAWMTVANGLNAPLVAKIGETAFTGVFRGIDASGSLLLEMADGSMKRIAAADVFPVH